MWVVGMGIIVEMDGRGRVTIPASIRRIVGKRKFRVELVGKDTIMLRAVEDREELVRKIASIKLSGDRERASVDAASVKDYCGGLKY